MYLNKKSGLWICHRCGVAGNLIILVSIVKKTTAQKAQKIIEEDIADVTSLDEIKNKLKDLDNLYSVFSDNLEMKLYAPPPPNSKIVNEENFPKILLDRKIPVSLIKSRNVKICLSGKYKGRLIFPFKCDGNVSFVAYSAWKQNPKTLNPPGGMNDRMIYQYDHINKIGMKYDNEFVIVVEGIFDCLRLQSYGFPCVALLGSFLSKNQAILLNQISYEKVIFMLDGDVDIEKYWKQLRNFRYISGKNVIFAPISDRAKDPDLLSIEEVNEILDHGTVPATETGLMGINLSRIKKDLF
jgi:DNA primase